jgi:carboxypeptidase C (cathepsin A)
MDRCVTLQSAAASPWDSVTIGHLRHALTGPDTWSEKYSIVSVYTGYFDVEARHLFFWFFESRRNPDEDDVMLWINGGAWSHFPKRT